MASTDASKALFLFNFHIRVIRVLFLGSSFDFLLSLFLFGVLQSQFFVCFSIWERDPVVILLQLVARGGIWLGNLVW
ncbi:hypothetical protein GBA52_024064, partial [Prunus armeniaca]